MKKLLLATLFSAVPVSAFAAPEVVVSIVPLHSLVAGVMEGVGEPELLLKGVNSEHQGSYSPQQISHLGHADLVFIIGDNLEVKLGDISGTETVSGKVFVKLNQTSGLVTHHIREGGLWQAHESEDEHTADNQNDPHIWLDTQNAIIMTQEIATTLAKIDFVNGATYTSNARKQIAAIEKLELELASDLRPVANQPFIVFHDAYQYFERRFGLNAVGSISDYSANPPSANRLAEIRSKILTSKAVCVFKEPQYSDAAISTVIEGSAARLGVLDGLGAKLTPGKFAYGQLMRDLAQNLRNCLGG